MAAARGGDFERLLQLLAPDAVVGADEAAVLAGTPASIEGRDEVAAFFNGSAQAALAVFVGDRPASAWFHRGAARGRLRLRRSPTAGSAPSPSAPSPTVLAQVVRRDGARGPIEQPPRSHPRAVVRQIERPHQEENR